VSAPLATLQLDPKMVESILTQQVAAAVVQQLGGSGDIVAKAVTAILLQQVDSNGRPTSTSYDAKGTLLNHTMATMVRSMLVDILKSTLESRRDEIEKLMVAAIKQQAKTMSGKFVTALAEGASRDWKFNVSIDPPAVSR
jgi:hypothetical protein